MKKNILITGGAGFIGSRLANLLICSGHNVKVLDNLSLQVHGEIPESSHLFLSLNPKVEFLKGCITDKKTVIKALDKIDTVIHLAAETGTGQSMYAIQHYSDINIGGTAVLLDLIANHPFPVKKIIVASSRAVYGEGKYKCFNHGFIFPSSRTENNMSKGNFNLYCPLCNEIAVEIATDESSQLKPASIYGVTKLAQEQMVLTVGKSLAIAAIALRYQNVYGPGQSLSNPYTGILSIFSNRIRNNKPINIFEDGNESRDFIYIDDVISITKKFVEYNKKIVDAFNVGSGSATDVITIAKLLQKELKIDVPTIITGKFRVGDIRHNKADLNKIENLLKINSYTDIKKGIKNFVKWVRAQKVNDDEFDKSIEILQKKGLFK